MNIGLDYDGTYTLDPDFWDVVITFGQKMGHSFYCVTNRHTPPETVPAIQIICCGDDMKEQATNKRGIKIDVWIDDMPGTIQDCKILEFGDTEQ